MDAEQRKLLGDIYLKIVDLQAADLRQAEASAAQLSALAASVGGALLAFAFSGVLAKPGETGVTSNSLFISGAALAALGLSVLALGSVLTKRVRSAMHRSVLARSRLVRLGKLQAAEAEGLGEWSIRRDVSRWGPRVPWSMSLTLELIGFVLFAFGVAFATLFWPA